MEDNIITNNDNLNDEDSSNSLNHKWYIVNTQSGYENKVKERIEKRALEASMTDLVNEVYIPSETVKVVKGGKKVSKEERFYPGYVLVKMVMNDATWTLVQKTSGVASFVGSHATTKEEGRIVPTALSDGDVARIFQDKNDDKRKSDLSELIKLEFDIGEKVKVIGGPFNGLVGLIDSINADKGKVVVVIEIFGRSTPAEMDFAKVSKI